jgi:hypothetical protein
MTSKQYGLTPLGVDNRLDDAYYTLQDAANALGEIANAQRAGELDPAARVNVTLLMGLIDLIKSALSIMLHIIPDWLPDPDYR